MQHIISYKKYKKKLLKNILQQNKMTHYTLVQYCQLC